MTGIGSKRQAGILLQHGNKVCILFSSLGLIFLNGLCQLLHLILKVCKKNSEAMISIFSTTMLVMYPQFCKSPAGHGLSIALPFNSILQMRHCYMHLICIESNFVLPQSLSWTHHFHHLQWEVHCLLHCFCNYTLKKMSPYCIHLICTIFLVTLGDMDCSFVLLLQ